MFMPVSGEILELNPALEESPDVGYKDSVWKRMDGKKSK